MISHNENMKKVVMSLFSAVPEVLQIAIISLLFYLIFGILGVIFFKGSFYSCNDPTVKTEEDCIGKYFNDGSLELREWKNQ